MDQRPVRSRRWLTAHANRGWALLADIPHRQSRNEQSASSVQEIEVTFWSHHPRCRCSLPDDGVEPFSGKAPVCVGNFRESDRHDPFDQGHQRSLEVRRIGRTKVGSAPPILLRARPEQEPVHASPHFLPCPVQISDATARASWSQERREVARRPPGAFLCRPRPTLTGSPASFTGQMPHQPRSRWLHGQCGLASNRTGRQLPGKLP